MSIDDKIIEVVNDAYSAGFTRTSHDEKLALKQIKALISLKSEQPVGCSKCDEEMERVKACEHIAEGDMEGNDWRILRNICPSTAAVATLRDKYEELLKREPTTHIDMVWEYFCDRSYYDQWAVREQGERRWGHCFHVPSLEEAKGLAEVLNEKSMKRESSDRLTKDLAMLCKRLAFRLGRGNRPQADKDVCRKAMDFLVRHNLQGSILRTEIEGEK